MPVLKLYIAGWTAACFVAVGMLIKKRIELQSNLKPYLKFLLVPWKLITFIIAAAGITLVAPYSGDYTWDYLDAIVISMLIYLTAPWSIGVFYRFFQKRSFLSDVYLAICFTLFSSSWFYDGYIFWRDGIYPPTWLSNLIISPTFYIAAGLFWNLDYETGKGAVFAFQHKDWFRHEFKTPVRKILWIMAPFMLFAFYGVVWFVWDNMMR